MKKIFLLSILLLIFNFTFADELQFIVQEDITLEDGNMQGTYDFKKNDFLDMIKFFELIVNLKKVIFLHNVKI